MSDNPVDMYEHIEEEMRIRRATHGPMAVFLRWTLPPDPRAYFVWSEAAHLTVERNGSVWRYVPLAAILVAGSLGLLVTLQKVPGLSYSVLSLLYLAFDSFLPTTAARVVTTVCGVAIIMSAGTYVAHTPTQTTLDSMPATRNWFYNFWLRMAVREETIFRAGAETWTWPERVRASMAFGTIHIVNIWYSFAAGIAVSAVGFALMVVYLWAYRKSQNQIYATAISGMVHALFNMVVITYLLGLVGFLVVVWLLGL